MAQMLIDMNKLLEELRELCRWHAENAGEFSILQRAIRIVHEQPTIDAVPVIRCKDCVSWRKSYFESVDGMVCNKTRYIMKPDDYCSMAKRKEVRSGNGIR